MPYGPRRVASARNSTKGNRNTLLPMVQLAIE